MSEICIVSIVEGHGETHAVPALLNKIAPTRLRAYRPIRTKRNQFIENPEERKKHLALARKYAAANKPSGVLIILDAETDCCQQMLAEQNTQNILSDIEDIMSDIPWAFVLVEKAYESWLVAGLRDEDEQIGNPREWLGRQSEPPRPYKKTVDQKKLTGKMDISKARERNPSFNRMTQKLEEMCQRASSA